MAEKYIDSVEKLQKQAGGLEPEGYDNSKYRPNKRNRSIRRKVYDRFYLLRDDPARTAAEEQWEMADKEYGLVTPDIDPSDWQSNLRLPDAFAAIQAQAQEDIERKARPSMVAVENSDEPKSEFANAVMNYNMNTTGFDYQYFLAKLSRTIRGTSFLMDYWRTDKRIVKDLTGVDEETGKLKFKEKELIDFDDDYTEWVPNEYIFIDEKAKHIDEAVDMIRREIINIDEFHRIYGNKAGFFDTEYVVAGGDTNPDSRIFKLPEDITKQDVEVLHYFNRSIDAYWVVANNVTICDDPLQSKHKELPISVLYQYRVPGQFFGMGIPKVIHHLSEERRSIRNLNMDRQKLIISSPMLQNSAFDIDDEDESIYPGKRVIVDTQGQPISQAVQPMVIPDVPGSYFKTEEILLEDIRRAHGIDDRIQGVNVGGTATEAAILKESSLKRVNMISLQAEMDTIIRIGRLKWSNIQFFYGAPRMEKITENDREKAQKVYRTISVDDKKFSIVNENGRPSLKMDDVKGSSAFSLKPGMAKYLGGDYDIIVNADIFTPVSRAIEQTKKTELFSMLMSNPLTTSILDITRATADLMKVNNVDPDQWIKKNVSTQDMQMLALSENMVMSGGQPLAGTVDATIEHTTVHLQYANTEEFKTLPPEVQQIIMDHIMQEHDNNPMTGSAAELMGGMAGGPEGGQPGQGDEGTPPPEVQAAIDEQTAMAQQDGASLSPGAGNTSEPQAQVADLQPTNFSERE